VEGDLDWALQRHNDFLETFVPLTFVGNHDVTRIASRLDDSRHLEHALVLLLTTGGTPSIYAGDEWGWRAVKEERVGGDDAVRPEFDQRPTGDNDILQLHQYLIGLRRRQSWLHTARTDAVEVSNTGYVYRTVADGRELTVALNIGDDPLPVALPRPGRITAGSGAPPPEHVADLVVPPHGWVIVEPQ
jgi:glycosidase